MSSRRISSCVSAGAPFFAYHTIALWCGSGRERTTSRILRLSLFLATAVEATFFDTTTATAVGASIDATRAEKCAVCCAAPERDTFRTNSLFARRYIRTWSLNKWGATAHVYTLSFARPRRRRARSTRRPAVVAVRAKNPCLRWRFFFFGWYVRFVAIGHHSTYKQQKCNRVGTTTLLSTQSTQWKRPHSTVFGTTSGKWGCATTLSCPLRGLLLRGVAICAYFIHRLPT